MTTPTTPTTPAHEGEARKPLDWQYSRTALRHYAGPLGGGPGEVCRKWEITDQRRFGFKHRPQDGYRLTCFGAHVRFCKTVKELKGVAQVMEDKDDPAEPPSQSLSKGTTGDQFEGHPIIQKALADFEAELPTPQTDAATHDDWSGGAEATEPEVSRTLERRLSKTMEEANRWNRDCAVAEHDLAALQHENEKLREERDHERLVNKDHAAAMQGIHDALRADLATKDAQIAELLKREKIGSETIALLRSVEIEFQDCQHDCETMKDQLSALNSTHDKLKSLYNDRVQERDGAKRENALLLTWIDERDDKITSLKTACERLP